jgi:hypothetical protein
MPLQFSNFYLRFPAREPFLSFANGTAAAAAAVAAGVVVAAAAVAAAGAAAGLTGAACADIDVARAVKINATKSFCLSMLFSWRRLVCVLVKCTTTRVEMNEAG